MDCRDRIQRDIGVSDILIVYVQCALDLFIGKDLAWGQPVGGDGHAERAEKVAHTRRYLTDRILADALPDISTSLSSEVLRTAFLR